MRNQGEGGSAPRVRSGLEMNEESTIVHPRKTTRRKRLLVYRTSYARCIASRDYGTIAFSADAARYEGSKHPPPSPRWLSASARMTKEAGARRPTQDTSPASAIDIPTREEVKRWGNSSEARAPKMDTSPGVTGTFTEKNSSTASDLHRKRAPAAALASPGVWMMSCPPLNLLSVWPPSSAAAKSAKGKTPGVRTLTKRETPQYRNVTRPVVRRIWKNGQAGATRNTWTAHPAFRTA